MSSLFLDVRVALRGLRKNPGFGAAVIVTLALGIGATLAVFTVVNSVLLRPLPYKDADQLVTVGHHNERTGEDESWLSYETLTDMPKAVPEIDSVAGVSPEWSFTMRTSAGAERLQGYWISSSLLPMLGVRPELGRNFSPDEDQPGGRPVVLLSHRLWQQRFGGSRDVLGRAVQFGSESAVVVGVLPAAFQFQSKVDLWAPLGQNPLVARGRQVRWVTGLARMTDGTSVAGARRSIDTYMRRLALEYPKSNAGLGARVQSLYEATVGGVRTPLWVLLAAVTLVLCIAVVNIGNLLLTRAAAREGEFAVRSALGASRIRLSRHLLTESLVLGTLGGGLGTLFGWFLLSLFRILGPQDLPRLEEVHLDVGALGIIVLLSLAGGLFAGSMPVLAIQRRRLSISLRSGGGRTTTSNGRLRDILVTAEIALALVLLVGAGLLLRSYQSLLRVNPGFREDGILTFQMGFIGDRTDPQKMAFYQDLWNGLTALPAVDAAGGSTRLPLTGQLSTRLEIRDQPRPAGDQPEVEFRRVSSGYFDAMGVPLRSGRLFTSADDDPKSPEVVVVNAALARRFWPGEDAVGRRVRFWYSGMPDDAPWLDVVGVVSDVRQFGLDHETPPVLYLPFGSGPPSSPYIAVHATGAPGALIGPIRTLLRQLDRDTLMWDVRPMASRLSASVASRRFSMALLAFFALLAVVLAAVGIFGVILFGVQSRLREIGVRVALGASRADVSRSELRRGVRLTSVGLGIGLLSAWSLTRLMRSMLFGIGPNDPLAFGSVSLLLFLIAVAASYLPARKAAAVDPAIVLREP